MTMGGGLFCRKGNGNGHRGRPYGLMLLLAFGAALVGVMALHKLREKRMFNLLVEEKNRQLISFQLLLQKEREYTNEMKRKAEETKAKIYSLRNQKMELNRRLLEMQSTIDSLKDEQKIMESELEEKQNEIKLLRDKDNDSGNENPQVIALTAAWKQKEAEIEDLKHRLNPPLNITIMGSMEPKEKTEFSREEGGRVHESSNKGGDNSTKDQDGNETKSSFSYNREGLEDGSEKKDEITLKMDMTGEGQLQKLESSGENARNERAAREMKDDYSKRTSTFKIDGANATDTIDGVGEQEKKSSFAAEQLERLQNPHLEGETQILQRTQDGGGKKLGIDENSKISRLPGRFGHLCRTKGKRWRILARNRFLKQNVNSEIDGGVQSMRNRRFSKEYKDVMEEGAVSYEGKAGEETERGVRKEIDYTKANFFKHRNNEGMSTETSHQVEGAKATSGNPDSSLAKVVPENTGANGEANNYTHDVKQLQVEETADIKQNMNSRDVKELKKKAELSSADRDETEKDLEVAAKQKLETEAVNGDLSSDFMSVSKDKELYKD